MIIVTGAAGLIGSAVVRELNRRGHDDLLLADHLGTSEKWMNLRTLRYADYLEKEDLIGRLKTIDPREVDAIIHLGACSATTERDATYLIQNNYRYSLDLATFAADHEIRMVYASSAATYGDGANGYADDEARLYELSPLNMYGYSKHMFDLHLARDRFAPRFAGIKYFNVYGPNEYHKADMMSVVLKSFRQIKSEGKMRLFKSYHPDYADGEQMRDFFYVKDGARLTVYLALDNPGANGLYNAGAGEARTWKDLGHAIFKAMDLEPNIEFIEMPEQLRGKYQYYTCAPMDKMKSIGYDTPPTALDDAVADYVRNYLAQDERRA